MADLSERVLAEIEKTEQIARHASPGPWTADAAFTGYWAVSTPDIGGGVVAASLSGCRVARTWAGSGQVATRWDAVRHDGRPRGTLRRVCTGGARRGQGW